MTQIVVVRSVSPFRSQYPSRARVDHPHTHHQHRRCHYHCRRRRKTVDAPQTSHLQERNYRDDNYGDDGGGGADDGLDCAIAGKATRSESLLKMMVVAVLLMHYWHIAVDVVAVDGAAVGGRDDVVAIAGLVNSEYE